MGSWREGEVKEIADTAVGFQGACVAISIQSSDNPCSHTTTAVLVIQLHLIRPTKEHTIYLWIPNYKSRECSVDPQV